MRSYERTASAITADPDGIAASQTPGGAGNLTLDGAGVSGGVATLTPPRPVAVTSAGNIAARVFTITGTDRKDQPITDTVTGVNANTVLSNKVFKTVTSIAVDAAAAAALTVGWTDISMTSWVFLGHLDTNAAYAVEVSGTVNFDVERTFRNILREGLAGDYDSSASDLNTAQTAALAGTIEAGVGAIRLVKNSGTGTCVLRVIPSRGR